MAKIILLSPPYIDLYGKLNKAAGRYFPLGLGYLASYLRKYGGHEVQMFEPEAQNLTYEDLKNIIRDSIPDVIGLTCSTPNFSKAIELARIAKTNSKAKIVIGGVHASAMPAFILEKYHDCIDCVVIGEGEITLIELVKAFEIKADVSSIKGIAYHKDGKVAINDIRPFIEDLDSIPIPARDLIPQELFAPNLHNARHKRCFSILTSRGCPFNCSFCASRIVSGRHYRVHSAEYVLSEMEMLVRDYKAKQLLITDDTFTMDRPRLEAICKGMIDKKLGLEWFCFSQVNTVDKDILKLMKKAGCYNIGFGIESADEEILKKIGKPAKPEKSIEAVNFANQAGLKTQAFYVFGIPGETKEQMQKTIEYSKIVNATLNFYNMLVPYPGTRDFEHYFAGVSLSDINWTDFVAIGENCVIKGSEVKPEEIEQLIASAYKEYYMNPKRILSILFNIRSFYEFINYLRAGWALFMQTLAWKKVNSI